jgi:drug/metabolite transporter (DMT)-like permease
MNPLLRRAAPLIFLLLWSGGFVFLKLGLRDADPITFLAIRFASVVVLLGIVIAVLRPPWPAGGKAWMHVLIVGLLMQACYFTGNYVSLKSGMSAGAVALISAQQPILIGLLAPMLAHERVDAVRWAGLVLGVAGACIVIASNSAVDVASPAGLAFAVFAVVSMTAGTLWEKRFGSPVHPVTASFVQCAVGLVVAAPVAAALEPMHVRWTGGLVFSLAYLVIGNSIIAISLLLAMIRRGEASRVSALFFLIPPVTAVIAWLVLHETLAWSAWPGMMLAAAGIYLVMRRTHEVAVAEHP